MSKQAAYLAEFSTFTPERQRRDLLIIVCCILDLIASKQTAKPPTPEEVVPEWIDHPEQERIDSVAARLLEDVNV